MTLTVWEPEKVNSMPSNKLMQLHENGNSNNYIELVCPERLYLIWYLIRRK